jgi:hypothetical protein
MACLGAGGLEPLWACAEGAEEAALLVRLRARHADGAYLDCLKSHLMVFLSR